MFSDKTEAVSSQLKEYKGKQRRQMWRGQNAKSRLTFHETANISDGRRRRGELNLKKTLVFLFFTFPLKISADILVFCVTFCTFSLFLHFFGERKLAKSCP